MIENIYKDYGYDDVLLGFPCLFENGINIYPIKIKDWKRFQRYIQYLILSKEHYGIKEDEPFIQNMIKNVIKILNNGKYPTDKNIEEQYLLYITKEMCDMFSMIFHEEKVFFKYNNGYCFISKDGEVLIDENNFNEFREIVLKQNRLFEPIIYKSKLKKKWAEKVKRGKEKGNNNISFNEILNIVRSGLQISYSEVSNMNILQLYVDFRRLSNTKEFEAVTMLKTTYGMPWDKLPNIQYQSPILEDILKNPELDYFKDFDGQGLMEMMK
ncbi:hypothetical protein DVV91_16700 [Clostridium botulinum]|uniref:hypothetical protein n=1 Tax=Clostridium botulinum TaxID=1491 RepID=UPI0019688943|nr:hypothetical protein [Clostridium botulinum]MBN1075962.1 hypothetical protein [Clostridium botulinum]